MRVGLIARRKVVLEEFPLLVSASIGIAVFVAWSVRWANRRWCPEPSWLDRSGRLVGAYWIPLTGAIGLLAELWRFIL